MTYACDHRQYGVLEGLAYRSANRAYLVERYGAEDARTELEANRRTEGK